MTQSPQGPKINDAATENKIERSSSVDVPPLLAEELDLLFPRLKSQLAVAGITTNNAKYRYTSFNLQTRALREVSDILRTSPDIDKHEKSKSRIAQLSTSQEGKLRELLAREGSVNVEQSRFFRRLSDLRRNANNSATSLPGTVHRVRTIRETNIFLYKLRDYN